MARYAEGTTVSVARSKAELEELVTGRGASNFISGFIEAKNAAVVSFTMNGRRVQFDLPLPPKGDFAQKVYKHPKWAEPHVTPRSPEEQHTAWEQACRERWRALFLVVKAKLEAVAAGISTFEAEFLADTVMPDGRRFAEKALPALASSYKDGKMPLLQLGDGGPSRG